MDWNCCYSPPPPLERTEGPIPQHGDGHCSISRVHHSPSRREGMHLKRSPCLFSCLLVSSVCIALEKNSTLPPSPPFPVGTVVQTTFAVSLNKYTHRTPSEGHGGGFDRQSTAEKNKINPGEFFHSPMLLHTPPPIHWPGGILGQDQQRCWIILIPPTPPCPEPSQHMT